MNEEKENIYVPISHTQILKYISNIKSNKLQNNFLRVLLYDTPRWKSENLLLNFEIKNIPQKIN